MIWFMVMQVFSALLEWGRVGQQSEEEKGLEVLLLRRQIAILERKAEKPVRASRAGRPATTRTSLRDLIYRHCCCSSANLLFADSLPP